MRIIEYNQYTLISSQVPEVVNNQIRKGLHYGGIKLTYTKQKIRSLEITILGNRILLPIKKFNSKEITFLRPFKQFWNVKENKLTPNNWGKAKSPYTNIWCELSNGNYDNIVRASSISMLVLRILSRRIDKNLISCLNKLSTKFNDHGQNLSN
jgi:hypothetical protein